MLISLNHFVDLLADRTGNSFSIPIQEELKLIVNAKRAQFFQQLIDKHPEQRKYYLKDFSVGVAEVPNAECPVDLGCTVLRTVTTIPYPTRTSYALFDYVGVTDKSDGYTYTPPDQLNLMLKWGSKYTSNRPKYFYVNGYIYIYNEDNIDYINVRGLWPDQRQLNKFKCAGVPCYTDDMQYDIPDDLVNSILRDIIANEIKLFVLPEQDMIDIDKTDHNNTEKE